MAKKVSFSGENLSLADAALHHNDTDGALTLFFSTASPSYPVRFAGYKPDEVREELGDLLLTVVHKKQRLAIALQCKFQDAVPQHAERLPDLQGQHILARPSWGEKEPVTSDGVCWGGETARTGRKA